tara:strand:- start:3966 stop:4196 length:231 start_codon:yes stop_codon:yes gene_type:complete
MNIKLSKKERNILIHVLLEFKNKITNEIDDMELAYKWTREISSIKIPNNIDEESEEKVLFSYDDSEKLSEKLHGDI